MKVFTAAAGAAASGVAAIGTAAISSFADYEQLVGGSKLMFGDAYDFIADKAQNAYSTVQMSQNDYLQQANGFATGLKTALNGDSQAAAELADKILTAEADIVAATGNSQESIQNAFNGIMKSNFTMLDNLQIGITPTKEGFQEVIDKVNDWNAANGKATKYQIDNLADCQSALVDYVEMQGLSGYAQEEAAKSIQGSLSMTKAAWSNLLTGIADDSADFDGLIDAFVESIAASAENILPRVEVVLTGSGELIEQLLPVIIDRIPEIIDGVLPKLLQSGINMIQSVLKGIQENFPAISESAIEVILLLVNSLLGMLPQLLEVGLQIILELALGIADALPDLIPTIINVVLKIVEILIKNAPKLLSAAKEIIVQLIAGLVKSFPDLLDKIPGFVTDMVNGFLSGVSDFAEIGQAIIDGIWSGISAGWEWLKSKVKEVAGSLFGAAKEELEVNSPSRKFKWLAEMCVAGWDEGSEGLMDMDGITKNVRASFGTMKMNAEGSNAHGGVAGFNQTININQPISTPDEMARAMRLEARYGLMTG